MLGLQTSNHCRKGKVFEVDEAQERGNPLSVYLSAGPKIGPVEAARKMELRADLMRVRKYTLRLLDVASRGFSLPSNNEVARAIAEVLIRIAEFEHSTCCASNCEPASKNTRLSADLRHLHLPNPNNTTFSSLRSLLATTRAEALKALDGCDLGPHEARFCFGRAWEAAIRNECTLQEALCEQLYTHWHRAAEGSEKPHVSVWDPLPATRMMPLPGGEIGIGSNPPSAPQDEFPGSVVQVKPFSLDRLLVSCSQWAAFMSRGGYSRKELWLLEGWNWRENAGIRVPVSWIRCGDGYCAATMDGLRPLLAGEPVYGISWYEADAYARWIRKRLPTEHEWEYAASWSPADGSQRLYPWGAQLPDRHRACAEMTTEGPLPCGDRTAGHSALDIPDMVGNVWEWTQPTTNEPDDLAICRGGSWVTSACGLNCTRRRSLTKITRTAFTGLRCAL